MDENVRREWGERLAEFRGEDPQPVFAERLGIDKGMLSRIERGKVKVTDDMKWLICGRLGVPMRVIFPLPPAPPALVVAEPASELPDLDRRRTATKKVRRTRKAAA